MTAVRDYLDLVRRLNAGDLNRSENDLSSNLKAALCAYGLHGTVDTSGGTDRIKRPDISLYTDVNAADVGSAAEVVIEAKRPREVQSFSDLSSALVSDGLWLDKFAPYVSSNAERVRFFVLTTFERFLIVPITDETRRSAQDLHQFETPDRHRVISGATVIDLRRNQDDEFARWVSTNLTVQALRPPPLSTILNLKSMAGEDALEQFANALADVVVGPEGRAATTGTLIETIQLNAGGFDDLDLPTQQGLLIYAMAAHGGMTIERARDHLSAHLDEELADFRNASVHSLIGRIFAMKAIEDGFCVDVEPPLIERARWVFHSERFDAISPEDLAPQFFQALADLSHAQHPAVKDLAATGRFYDWLVTRLNPAAFRRLLDLFFTHDLSTIDGDLLGRFFEMYAQRVDRRRRRQLGQYYTPLAIVRHMWRQSLSVAQQHRALSDIVVLDPAVGSGTFLIEGASQLQEIGIDRFWERLTGFDISAQAIGIAQVNLYVAVLAHLDRERAEEVGSLCLFPTDALDPRNGARLRSIRPLLQDESTRAFLTRRIELSEVIKQRSRFPIVIGNPPYRNNSDQTLAHVAEKFPRLLRSSRQNARARDRNIRDDYAWFFAAADYYLSDRGVISFVVSDSFCYAHSYRFFREDLLRAYSVCQIVNLGGGVFRDVGPRTQFVIIVLERRAEELPRASDAGPFPYIDLRPLTPPDPSVCGTPQDARLSALQSGELPEAVPYQPSADRSYSFFPATDVVRRVLARGTPLCGRADRRVFLKKWPGIITAFDELFRGDSAEQLETRFQEFFTVAAATRNRARRLDEFAAEIGAAAEKKRQRLEQLADQARGQALQFDETRIRRAVTGSAPNEVTWYPDERLTAWVYYEPRLAAPRNVNEGRDPGWGTMSQWREPESHAISPKLVFTTSTNPRSGFKAFVLDDSWIVKVHGGESQQFNYTGVNDPTAQAYPWGPNNLGADALGLFNSLHERGYGEQGLLHYVAAIYNSELAREFLEGGGGNTLHIPMVNVEIEQICQLVDVAWELRDLHQLLSLARTGADLPLSFLQRLRVGPGIEDLGFVESQRTGGRFIQNPRWRASERADGLIVDRIGTLLEELNEDVEGLFN